MLVGLPLFSMLSTECICHCHLLRIISMLSYGGIVCLDYVDPWEMFLIAFAALLKMGHVLHSKLQVSTLLLVCNMIRINLCLI